MNLGKVTGYKFIIKSISISQQTQEKTYCRILAVTS